MRRHSTYKYAFDNPIRYLDPDGMAPDASTTEFTVAESQQFDMTQSGESAGGLESGGGDVVDPPKKSTGSKVSDWIKDKWNTTQKGVETVIEMGTDYINSKLDQTGDAIASTVDKMADLIKPDGEMNIELPIDVEPNTANSKSNTQDGLEVVDENGGNNAPTGKGTQINEPNDYTDPFNLVKDIFSGTTDYSNINGSSFYVESYTGDTMRLDVKGSKKDVDISKRSATKNEIDSLARNAKNLRWD